MKYYYITNPDGTWYNRGRGLYLFPEQVREWESKGYTLITYSK